MGRFFKKIQWYEVRHQILTLRRLGLGFWQLTDSRKQILAEGRRGSCLDKMDALLRSP